MRADDLGSGTANYLRWLTGGPRWLIDTAAPSRRAATNSRRAHLAPAQIAILESGLLAPGTKRVVRQPR